MRTKQDDNTEIQMLDTDQLAAITGGKGFIGTVWDGAKEVGSWVTAPIYNAGYDHGSRCGKL
jgi:hypothetical protein